jgi:hypothetical protein
MSKYKLKYKGEAIDALLDKVNANGNPLVQSVNGVVPSDNSGNIIVDVTTIDHSEYFEIDNQGIISLNLTKT